MHNTVIPETAILSLKFLNMFPLYSSVLHITI
jgi:hypothetical protein